MSKKIFGQTPPFYYIILFHVILSPDWSQVSKDFPFQKFLKSEAFKGQDATVAPLPPYNPRPEKKKTPKKKNFPSTTTAAWTKKRLPKSAKEATFSLLSNLQESTDELKDKVQSQYLGHICSNPTTAFIDKTKTFDNFIVGPSNNLAFVTAQAVAMNPGEKGKYPSLYIYSRSGLGKTHLLHAVANEVIRSSPTLKICLINAREFMKEMIEAIRNKDIGSFQNKFMEKTDVLMIDDIHELKHKEGTQNEFFHIFNKLHTKGKQLLFTSDKSPKEIDGIEDRIKTRLQWGLVLDIQKPDFETRMAILKKKAQGLDLFLQDDVADLIATFCRSSIRELEGSLIRLSAYAQVMNVEIDLELSKELLGINSNTRGGDVRQRVLTLESIAETICHHYKIPLADLRSRMRGHLVSQARHIGMYLSRKLTSLTHKEIGHFYGGRDHTSVLHATGRVENLAKKKLTYAKEVASIEELLLD